MESYKNVVTNTSGDSLSGATITIYDAGTTNKSTIYSDNDSTALANPFTSDSEGEFEFWATDGRYDVVTTYSGLTDTKSGILLFDPIGGGSTTDIKMGPTASPALFLDVSAKQLQIGKGLTTEDASLEIGTGRTGNGVSQIDLIGDATYTDYGLRLRRTNTGANAFSFLSHRGTGALVIESIDAGSIRLETNNTLALTVDSSENVGIGISTPDTNLHVWNGSAGVVSAATNSVLTIENSTTNYLSFLNPNNVNAGIIFGDVDNNSSGYITYSHSGPAISLGVEGVTSVRADDDATAGNTRLLIYDVDNATLERVSVGAADSGGVGFKVLRIAN